MASGDELLLPEVLIFQEAHVPDGTPKSALRIDGYQDPVTEGLVVNNLLTYVRSDLPTARTLPVGLKKKDRALTNGRLQVVSIQYEGHSMAILNVHGPHRRQEDFWKHTLGLFTQLSSQMPAYIVGDTNSAFVPGDRPHGLTKSDRDIKSILDYHCVQDLTGFPSHFEHTHHPHNSNTSRLDRVLGLPHPMINIHSAEVLRTWKHVQGNPLTYHHPLLVTFAIHPITEHPIPDDCSPAPSSFTFPPAEATLNWRSYLNAVKSALQEDKLISVQAAATKAALIQNRQRRPPRIAVYDAALHRISKTNKPGLMRRLIRRRTHYRQTQINREIKAARKQSNVRNPVLSIRSLSALLKPVQHRQITSHRRPDGTITTDPAEVTSALANTMKSHLNPRSTSLSKFTRKCLNKLPTITALRDPRVLAALEAAITEAEMDYAIKKLNPKARPGNDGIPTTVYKRLGRMERLRLAEQLTEILRDPDKDPWRERVTNPTYKAGDPAVHTNWRPLTFPSSDQKILWIIILRRIAPYIFDPSIIPLSMWGFLPNRSTREISSLIEDFLDHILNDKNKDNPLNAIMTALDLKGAFDKVSHLLVESVWKKLGLPWGHYLTAHLREATQKYKTAYSHTPPVPVTSGVPQGGIEGSILFILALLPLTHYIRDHFPDDSPLGSPQVGFADDLNLMTCVRASHE